MIVILTPTCIVQDIPRPKKVPQLRRAGDFMVDFAGQITCKLKLRGGIIPTILYALVRNTNYLVMHCNVYLMYDSNNSCSRNETH